MQHSFFLSFFLSSVVPFSCPLLLLFLTSFHLLLSLPFSSKTFSLPPTPQQPYNPYRTTFQGRMKDDRSSWLNMNLKLVYVIRCICFSFSQPFHLFYLWNERTFTTTLEKKCYISFYAKVSSIFSSSLERINSFKNLINSLYTIQWVSLRIHWL